MIRCPCIFRISLLFALAGWYSTTGFAQAGPPMLTDDPGTVSVGRWEINLAWTTEHSVGEIRDESPLLDINYGLGERVQLKYEVPLVRLRANGNASSAPGDSLAGLKWRFFDGGENGWQISTYPQIQIGGGRAQVRIGDSSGNATLFPIELQHTFGAFVFNAEVGRWLRADRNDDSWIAGIVIGHEFTKGFEMTAELHDEISARTHRDELIVNVGARGELSERYTVLVSAGRDLHNSLGSDNRLIAYLGLQLHL